MRQNRTQPTFFCFNSSRAIWSVSVWSVTSTIGGAFILCLIRLPQAKPELKSTRAQNTGSLVLREIGGSHLLGHGDRSVRLSHNLNTVLDIVVLDLEHESTHSTKDFHWIKE